MTPVVMALDVGDKTIGVAISNELGWTEPVVTLRRKRQVLDLEALRKLATEREVTRVIVGLPFNMDGSEGPRALKSRRFAEAARAALGLPVLLWDERLTTFEAERQLIDAGVSRERRREIIDMVAAQNILRAYLDAGCPEQGC